MLDTNATAIRLGTKIYYTGDMANQSGHFTVTTTTPGWVTLTEEPGGEDRVFKGIHLFQIGHVYHGHCNPRFVTEVARQAYRNR